MNKTYTSTADPKAKCPTTPAAATKPGKDKLQNKGERLLRPARESAGFKWRDHLARELGWRIWDVLHPLMLEASNPKQIRRAFRCQVQGLLNGPFGEDILTSAACMTDPMKMLLKLLKGVGRHEPTTVDELILRATVRDFLHCQKPLLHELRGLEDICLKILGVIRGKSDRPVANWPSHLCARA
jgi:hypothetical protein